MRRLLFVDLLGGIGDLIIALPAIQALGRSYPNAALTVLTFAPGSALLRHDPLVSRVVSARRKTPDRPHNARQSVAALLARDHYDVIVSDTCYDEIPRLIEAHGAARAITNLWQHPPVNQLVGERFVELLIAAGIIAPEMVAPPRFFLTPREWERARRLLAAIPKRPRVMFFAESGMPIKQWPARGYVALGRALHREYGAQVLVLHDQRPALAAAIAAELGDTAQLLPRLGLRTLAALIAQADLFVAGDTGPTHLAAALGVPTITLFGPSWSRRYGHRAPHRDLQAFAACPVRCPADATTQPCWYTAVCPVRAWSTCLEAITPEQVLAAARPLLERQPADAMPRTTVALVDRPAEVAQAAMPAFTW